MSDNVHGEPRHPSTEHMLKMLEPNKNLPSHLYNVADNIYGTALRMVDFHGVPEGPELTVALRKLLEAKDCFVRALVFKDE